jgi:hypothetical protein
MKIKMNTIAYLEDMLAAIKQISDTNKTNYQSSVLRCFSLFLGSHSTATYPFEAEARL